jgi:hypothetical protein
VNRAATWIDPMPVAAGRVRVPAGRRYTPPPDPVTEPRRKPRLLNAAAVRRNLSQAPRITRDWTIIVHTDLSGSMIGGNDAAGLRHEALLVLAEHLAATGRSDKGARWHLRVHSFDDGFTCLDIERTPIDRRTVRSLERALLGETWGGSSNLGPSLRTSIAESGTWAKGGIVRVVLSDFELLDPDVPGVLQQLLAAPAEQNVAIAFRSPVPPALLGTAVATHHVDPSRDAAETVATIMAGTIAKAAAEDQRQEV